MPDTDLVTLTPLQVRQTMAALKTGEVTLDDIKKRMGKLTPESQAAIRKASPVYMNPPAATSSGAIDELKQYGKELLHGGPARDEVADASSRFVHSIADNLNPTKVVPAFIKAVESKPQREADWIAGKRQGPTLTEMRDNPAALAEVISPENLGALAAAPVADSIRVGGNKVGTALATNEKVQNAANLVAGTAVGAGGAKSMGLSPFIGGYAGRNLFKGSTIPARVGEVLERVTGGRAGGAPTPTPGGLTDVERAGLEAKHFPPELIARMDAEARARATTGAAPPPPRPTAPTTPTAGPAPSASVATGPAASAGPVAGPSAAPPPAASASPVTGSVRIQSTPSSTPPVVNRVHTPADYASDIAHLKARGLPVPPELEKLAQTPSSGPQSTPPAASPASAMPGGPDAMAADYARDAAAGKIPRGTSFSQYVMQRKQAAATGGGGMPDAFKPVMRSAVDKAHQSTNFGQFIAAVDKAMEGAPSKSKAGSGMWKNLSDNDAITASNAYAAGVRDPQQIVQAILEKRKNRQADHIGNHYLDKREKPE